MEAVRPLRLAVLRPGRDASSAVWPGDDSGAHYGVRIDGSLRSVGSVVREGDGWRVRGMATDPSWRGRGLGALVLGALLAHAGDEPVWCHARVGAVSLYERAGFEVVGEPFEEPGIGPHVLMELRRGVRGRAPRAPRRPTARCRR